MIILGLSCFYHDSAACLLRDGEIIAACQEERFSRIKHDWQFPFESISWCLDEAAISINDISLVSFYEKPILKFERVLEPFLSVAPKGYRAFLDTMPSWLKQKLWLPHILKKRSGFTGHYRGLLGIFQNQKEILASAHRDHAPSAGPADNLY